MKKAACGLVLGLAMLAPAEAVTAAEITVMRGSSTEVVSTSGGKTRVTVLRGTPAKKAEPVRERREVSRSAVAPGFQGTGENLWYVDARGRVRACWLTGTTYVNSLKIVCNR